MSESVSVDHVRPSYSASRAHNPREEQEETSEIRDSEHVNHPDESDYSDRWSRELNPRVPSRPPGELRPVNE